MNTYTYNYCEFDAGARFANHVESKSVEVAGIKAAKLALCREIASAPEGRQRLGALRRQDGRWVRGWEMVGLTAGERLAKLERAAMAQEVRA